MGGVWLYLALVGAVPSVELCPLGDQINVAVYDFVGWELGRAEPRARTRDEVRKLVQEDAGARGNPEFKPPYASVVETQLSHLVNALCASAPACLSAALYDKSGLALALSSKGRVVDVYGIESDERWAEMTKEASATSLPCPEAKRVGVSCKQAVSVVAFPIRDGDRLLGVARCIVKGRPVR